VHRAGQRRTAEAAGVSCSPSPCRTVVSVRAEAPGHTEHPADASRDRRRRCDAAAPGGDPRAGRSRADRGQPPRLAALATGPPGL